MAAVERVQLHALDHGGGDELVPDPVLRVEYVRGEVLHEAGEALVEPEVGPPLHGHQVAEPLVGRLMAHHQRNIFLANDVKESINQSNLIFYIHQSNLLENFLL
jgi:hypothetical protein